MGLRKEKYRMEACISICVYLGHFTSYPLSLCLRIKSCSNIYNFLISLSLNIICDLVRSKVEFVYFMLTANQAWPLNTWLGSI